MVDKSCYDAYFGEMNLEIKLRRKEHLELKGAVILAKKKCFGNSCRIQRRKVNNLRNKFRFRRNKSRQVRAELECASAAEASLNLSLNPRDNLCFARSKKLIQKSQNPTLKAFHYLHQAQQCDSNTCQLFFEHKSNSVENEIDSEFNFKVRDVSRCYPAALVAYSAQAERLSSRSATFESQKYFSWWAILLIIFISILVVVFLVVVVIMCCRRRERSQTHYKYVSQDGVIVNNGKE